MQFPLPPGTEVPLKCSPGHTLTGDTTVTCEEGTTFSFTESPSCVLGLIVETFESQKLIWFDPIENRVGACK